jgi:hypothetical protein
LRNRNDVQAAVAHLNLAKDEGRQAR